MHIEVSDITTPTTTQAGLTATTVAPPPTALTLPSLETKDVLSGVMTSIIFGIIAFIARTIWKGIKSIKETPSDVVTPTVRASTTPDSSCRFIAPSHDPHAKLAELTAALESRELASENTALDSPEGRALTKEIAELREHRRQLTYLDADDVLDERFRLIKPLSTGDQANVWLAENLEAGKNDPQPLKVIKVLPYPYAERREACEWFFRAIQRLRRSHIGYTPSIYGASNVNEGRDGYIPYYAMDHIEGVPLGQFVQNYYASVSDMRSRFKFGMRLTEALLETITALTDAHNHGLVHGDLHPNNFVVFTPEPDKPPRLFLLDFDTLSIDGALSPLPGDPGNAGYQAPERVEGLRKYGRAADIFSLGRIIVFLFSGNMPSAHALGTHELIDKLDCPIALRNPLIQATKINPDERHESLKQFAEQLRAGLESERNDGRFAHWRADVRNARDRIPQTLRFAFIGALLPMLTTRPFLAHEAGYGGLAVHLSDMLPIGAFHAIIGSFIWAVSITAAYLFCQSVSHRSGRVNFVFAAIACGLGGFIGGVAVALLGAGITNACTLHALGWFPGELPTDCAIQSGIKIAQSLRSHLLWAFPLTGTFTGIGLGVWLNIKVNSLIEAGVGGVVPIPQRTFSPNVSALANSVLFVFGRQTFALIWLTLPIWAAAIAYVVFDLHSTGVQQAWRSVGEGLVHSAAALGLGVGFFCGVVPLPFTQMPRFIRKIAAIG